MASKVWMFGTWINVGGSHIFIDTLFTQLGTTGNYSTIAILRTLQFTVTHALGFSVLTNRLLATDLQKSHGHFKSHMKSSFHSLLPFLSFLLLTFDCHHLPQLDQNLDNSIDFLCPFITPRQWPRRKHSLCIVQKACLLILCLAMEVLLLAAHPSAGICLLSRCLAMGLYVTILFSSHSPDRLWSSPNSLCNVSGALS
jgi:hypothetical protein